MLLLACLVLLAAAWLRGAEYDEQYTLFLTAGTPRPDWPGTPLTAAEVVARQGTRSGAAAIARDLRATDVHPPLYFWTVAAWRMSVADGLFGTRLLSVGFSVGALALVGALARRAGVPAAVAMLLTLGCYGFVYTGVVARGFALAQVLLERAFAQSMTSGVPVKPWSWADTWPVARIEVPRLGASAIALKGASGQALAFGPGHLDNTPQAGEEGTAVYAAHRDTHFSFLKDIKENDRIRITRRDGRIFSFRVTHMAVARWDEAEIDTSAPGVHLVLATCFPFDAVTSGPLRYLVYADLEEAAAP